jgi:4-amino-4-deoxy-L-arabinose transferase-like glycosyltransferase
MKDEGESPSIATPDKYLGRRRLIALGAVLILGAALRFYALDRVPPGMWFDEALKAQDAFATAHTTGPKLVYLAEFPREPLFIWILALTSKFISSEVIALRATSGVIGVVTLLALFFCVRQYAGTHAAIAAAAVLATLRWHVLFSRLLFRSLLLPLVVTLIVWLGGRAKENRTWPSAVLFGAAMGAGFYTYLAWYFILPGVLALFWWVYRESDHDRHVRKMAAIAAIAGLAVAAPILSYYIANPEKAILRPSAVLPTRAHGNSAIGEIAENFFQVFGMFHYKGDHVARQNFPHAPALDWVQGVFFVVGLAVCISRVRKRDAFSIVALSWIALGALPTVLTYNDSPNFLRSLVMTPALAIVTAMGVVAAADFVSAKIGKAGEGAVAARKNAAVFALATVIIVAASAAITSYQLFVRFPKMTEVWAAYNGAEYQLGQAAAETPKGTSFWIPGQMARHRTIQYLSRDMDRKFAFGNFNFLNAKIGPRGPRRVVATAHNQVHVVLDRFIPRARMIYEFKRPDGGVWALLYEIPEDALPPPEDIDRIAATHPVRDLGY